MKKITAITTAALAMMSGLFFWAMGTASATARSPILSSPSPMVLEPCSHGQAICAALRPTTRFTLMAGPSVYLQNIYWSHWTAVSAHASGTLYGFDLKVSRIGHATILLNGPKWTSTGGGLWYFSRAYVQCRGPVVTGLWTWRWSEGVWLPGGTS